MQLQDLSVRSLPFDGPQNEDTISCQAKKYVLVIYAIWAFDRYVLQIDTSCFSYKNHLFSDCAEIMNMRF